MVRNSPTLRARGSSFASVLRAVGVLPEDRIMYRKSRIFAAPARPQEPIGLAFPPATQLAKTTLFASGNEADVRQTRRSAFGRPEVDPKGAVQGGIGTKSAVGDFFQWTKSAGSRLERRER